MGGVTKFSLGFWSAITSIIATGVSWSFYTFGYKFCAVAARRDALPWVIGSIGFVIISVAVCLAGALQFTSNRQQLKERKPKDAVIHAEKDNTANTSASSTDCVQPSPAI